MAEKEHGVAKDKGRNVHCICGAEYSLKVNLMRHIDSKETQE